ncbi:hypothetical protein CPLU01_09980 [Colletotrichum plurivorum]|uniref:Uncharacterized protein n=1 Tax=Colletotrichum plurivorum TaxID=2175906 RepID=A0A8H6NAV9_9PEZI|nr:hypothetical protein CPLU01_09980 [Colletotrichum plurivorum]
MAAEFQSSNQIPTDDSRALPIFHMPRRSIQAQRRGHGPSEMGIPRIWASREPQDGDPALRRIAEWQIRPGIGVVSIRFPGDGCPSGDVRFEKPSKKRTRLLRLTRRWTRSGMDKGLEWSEKQRHGRREAFSARSSLVAPALDFRHLLDDGSNGC